MKFTKQTAQTMEYAYTHDVYHDYKPADKGVITKNGEYISFADMADSVNKVFKENANRKDYIKGFRNIVYVHAKVAKITNACKVGMFMQEYTASFDPEINKINGYYIEYTR